MEFVVIGYDGTDEQALDRRNRARPAHLESVSAFKQSGALKYAVALLNESGAMCGSVMVFDVNERTDIDRWLEREPYVTQGVWKSVSIFPARVAAGF